MRFIDRAAKPKPPILSSPEVLDAKSAIGAHYQLAPDVRARRRVPVNMKLWVDETVRGALQDLFHNKCAFCETSLPSASAQIEHFRPLANAQSPTRKQQSPDHYGWFAYEWRNLLLVCIDCGRAKANLFPVNGPRAPILCSWDEAQRAERCELLDPCSTQPWRHLAFNWNGRVSGKTGTGRATVSLLDLNRPELVQRRHDTFQSCLQAMLEFRDKRLGSPSIVLHNLRKFLSDEAPFSGSLSILLHDVFRILTKTGGIAMPTRARLNQNIENLLRRFGDDLWHELKRQPYERGMDDESPFQIVPLDDIIMEREELVRSSRRSRAVSAQIRRVHIENFKGISDLSLTFPESGSGDPGAACTMLLGENSTGKSSVLQAIALCLMGDSLRHRLRLKPEDYLPREAKNWQFVGIRRARITIDFDTGSTVTLEIDPAKGEFVGLSEPGTIMLAYGARRYFGKPAKRINPFSSIRSLFDPLATLNHPGLWLERIDSDEFSAVSRAMREILALRPDDDIERDEEGRLFVKAHGRDTPLDHLSEGYRTLFTMAIDVMREMISCWGNLEEARGVVLIDEIETHLHPRWKMLVVSALRKAMPNVQFIATTHDPLCLRGMRNGEVHVLIRNSESEVEEMLDLPDVRGLRSEQLLISDFFGLASTSDPDVELGLEEIAILAGSRKMDQAKLANARTRVLPFTLIGDTQQEQIVNEAMKRFLLERRNAPAIDRKMVRERAVNAVLEGLRDPRRNDSE